MPKMGKRCVVSVVVPTYNRAHLVRDTLESVQRQTLRDIEIWVVDDGSRDGTAALVQGLASGDARIRLVQQDNRGLAAARNAGLLRATGRYVAFLDDDDFWTPQALEVLVSRIEDGVGVVACHALGFFSEAPGLTPEALVGAEPPCPVQPWPPGPIPAAVRAQDLLLRPYFPINAALFSRELLVALGGFDVTLREAEDYHLWLRLALRHPIPVVPMRLALVRFHPPQMSADLGRMAAGVRRVLEGFVAAHPALAREVGWVHWRRRLGGLAREEAYAYLLRQEGARAAAAARDALRYWPADGKAWAYLILARFPRVYLWLRKRGGARSG